MSVEPPDGKQPITARLLGFLLGKKPFHQPGETQPPDEESIEAWLVARISHTLEVAPEEIDPREPFSSFGLDSRTAVRLSGELERWLGRRLPATLIWDYPTIELVAKHLAGGNDPPVPGSAENEVPVPGQTVDGHWEG
jgi:acyl carrier protein